MQVKEKLKSVKAGRELLLQENINEIDRRRFLKLSAALAAILGMPAASKAGITDKWGNVLPQRKLGSTELDVTLFTIGGGAFDADYAKSESIIETAIQGGCRFFETARRYGRGESERQFGNHLPPYRKEIVLMSKTYAEDTESLNRELDISLQSLKTDYIDIYLMHNMRSPEDIENRLKGGVLEALVRAKEEGKIGHIGFSGHNNPESLNYLIDKGFADIEVILLPVTVADPVQNSFILNTLPKAIEKNMGIIGMKVLAGGGYFGGKIPWGRNKGKERARVIPDIISKKEAQHFAYSLPVASTTIGCHNAAHVRENISYAKTFSKLSDEEYKGLIERVKETALNNTLESYKTE